MVSAMQISARHFDQHSSAPLKGIKAQPAQVLLLLKVTGDLCQSQNRKGGFAVAREASADQPSKSNGRAKVPVRWRSINSLHCRN